jgi:hypothetical protein
MTDGIFASIRSAAAAVMSRARHVRIDTERLPRIVDLLDSPPSTVDPARRPFAEDRVTLAYVVTLNAINFGSGFFPHLRKHPGRSGYLTVANSLREHFERGGSWEPKRLAALAAADVAAALGQDLETPERAELMEWYAAALRDLGRLLVERHDGRFERLVAAARGSAARLVELVAEMPSYRDVSRYAELEVPFYKRAQILAADLAAAFDGAGLGAFHDLGSLTAFADNLVPHVLRREGVLVYAPDLARCIDSGELIAAESPEEVEIRAAAVHAVESIVSVARGAGREVSAAEVDAQLWTRGQRPEYKAHPRHRTRTTCY